MIRKLAVSVSAAALAVAGLAAATINTASAATIITAGAGSSIDCHVIGSAKIVPALKDDWKKADHTTDPNADVKNLPDTFFSSTAHQTTSLKFAQAAACTGTVTDGVHSAGISKIAITVTIDPAHPTTSRDSCLGFAREGLGLDPPSTAKFIETIKYTSNNGTKITGTTIHDSALEVPAAGFYLNGGTITGSFAGAGGTAEVKGNVDDTTAGIFLDDLAGPAPDGTTVATSTSPAAPNVCQAALKIKTGTHHSATLKAPKGLKSIIFNAAGNSSFTASR